MNLDAQLTRAGEELSAAVTRRLDGDGVLAALHRTRRRRRTVTASALVSAFVVLALAVVAVLGLPSARDRGPVEPAPTPRACAPESTAPCAGGGLFRVSESVPFVWTLPASYLMATHGSGHALTYVSAAAWPDTTDASALTDGVTVLVDAAPSDPRDPSRAPANPPSRSDARSLATWIAGRPFVDGAEVRPTVVDGRPAWELDVTTHRLDPAVQVDWRLFGEKAGCGCPVVAAVLRQTTSPAGMPRDWMPLAEQSTARLWLVDLPGGHVAAIRAANQSDPTYSVAQRIVDSLRFGAPQR